jgi:putative serine protease PepD
METEKKIYTTVVIVTLVGLLFSCIVGALAGGVAGFLVGQRQGRVAAERALGEGFSMMPGMHQVPSPWQDEVPVPKPGPGTSPANIEGALVLDVVPGTPADNAGLQAGDIITAIDRTPVDATHLLPDVIGQYRPGDRVTVRFWRGDQEESATVRLTANPDDAGKAYLGIYFETLSSSRPGD